MWALNTLWLRKISYFRLLVCLGNVTTAAIFTTPVTSSDPSLPQTPHFANFGSPILSLEKNEARDFDVQVDDGKLPAKGALSESGDSLIFGPSYIFASTEADAHFKFVHALTEANPSVNVTNYSRAKWPVLQDSFYFCSQVPITVQDIYTWETDVVKMIE